MDNIESKLFGEEKLGKNESSKISNDNEPPEKVSKESVEINAAQDNKGVINEVKKEIYELYDEKERQPEKIFGHCFELKRIEEGDFIPVGGENQFTQETNIQVKGDFSNLGDWFEKMKDMRDKIANVESIMTWAERKGLDKNIFASIAAFTKTFEKVYSPIENPELSRNDMYSKKGKEIKLSDIFKGGVAKCAEIAAVAQYELQQQGVKSSYFSGDVLWNKEEEFSEEHSFLVIKQGDKTFIFDPTNPVKTKDGNYPSIYMIESDFNQEVRNGKKRFVVARNVLTNIDAYFGVNDGTNVSDKDIACPPAKLP